MTQSTVAIDFKKLRNELSHGKRKEMGQLSYDLFASELCQH